MSESQGLATVRYAVRRDADAWELPEVPVPESYEHDQLSERLVALLKAWRERTQLDALVTRNLAVRWVPQNAKVGVDPDVALVVPAPPLDEGLSSLCLWLPGHAAPRLAIEVVSKRHPYKDYRDIHEKYAASGIGELWILDPLGHGPKALGGPVPIQQWIRCDEAFDRVHFGSGPVYSEAIDAWLWSNPVRISDDRDGMNPWLTVSEMERAAKDAALAREDAERREKEVALEREETQRARAVAAEARIAELERRLGSKGGG
ncbi:MAG: Uma2 family endonuclease [Polyangiaceae bacterium]